MLKTKLTRPAVIMLLGLPGSGKSYTSANISELLGMALVSEDKIRDSLFEETTLSEEENTVVMHTMIMMTEEYLRLGLPVMFDAGLNKIIERKTLREIARKYKADSLLIWLQIDQDTARLRTKVNKKQIPTEKSFDIMMQTFQTPHNEDYIVLSGKHTFESQKPIIVRKLREQGLISDETMKPHIPMPGMMNLAAQAKYQSGRVDYSRRNISIG